MSELIVRVEAVNFTATILDTNDLSTMRGGGLAALYLGDVVGAALAKVVPSSTPLHSGASQCAFRITIADGEDVAKQRIEAEIRAALNAADGKDGKPPYAYTMHVVSVAPVKPPGGRSEEEAALAIAEARGHARQFRQWTELPIAFSEDAEDADPLDGVRPATVPTYFPKGKVLDPDDEGVGADRTRASPSVHARLRFGRKARQDFYRQELKSQLPQSLAGRPPELSFAQSFQDIVKAPPQEAGLSVQSKIAVVYADGNGFGKARTAVGTIEFGKQLAPLRKSLLQAVVTWLADGAASPKWEDVFAIDGEVRGRQTKGLRFETILWGGDEVAFVMPAWLATTFVEGFFRHTADWSIRAGANNFPLTHAVGVAIGHHKVPIRQLRAIAKTAADTAKEAGLRDGNTATFEVFESLHPPDTDLERWRRTVFGAVSDDAALARRQALPGDGGHFTDVLTRLETIVWGDLDRKTGRWRKAPFPRSQLYAALRALREAGVGVGEATADQIVAEAIDRYSDRAGADRGLSLDDLRLPAVANGRGAAMDAALVATLWDYANPFGGDFPHFAAVTAPSGAPA